MKKKNGYNGTYHRRKELGLCTDCGKRPPVAGMIRCEECRAIAQAKSKERWAREKASREEARERNREKMNRRTMRQDSLDHLKEKNDRRCQNGKFALVLAKPDDYWIDYTKVRRGKRQVYNPDSGEIPFHADRVPEYCLDIFVRDAVKAALYTCGQWLHMEDYTWKLDRDGFIRYRREASA